MSKLEQILILDPPIELKFKGPFKEVVTTELHLSNPSDQKVAFKVKTTAPKRYCVRPNSGIIEPKAKVTVAVMLQPFDYDPNEKNKHKFMVQSVYVPSSYGDNLDQLWKDAKPDELMDSKLKCFFDMPPEAAQNNIESPVSQSAAAHQVDTPAPKVSHPTESSSAAARDESAQLREEIRRLRNENQNLKEETLRQRKAATSSPDSASSAPANQSGGLLGGRGDAASVIPPLVFLVAAVILGLVFGKYLL
jgi:vesicle-associated membrane protein-associated protein A